MKDKKTVYDLISRNLRHVNIDNQSRMIVATPVISSSTNVCIANTNLNKITQTLLIVAQ